MSDCSNLPGMTTTHRALALCLLLGACVSRQPHARPYSVDLGSASGQASAWEAPNLERATSIRDGHDGHLLSLDGLLDELADFDVVFLGETHTDETTHRVELAVYEGMLDRRQGEVVLAMEMFERDVQGVIDDYLAGRIGEREFLEEARPWGNYRTGYRPMIERARADGVPVFASNFPRPLRTRLAREGRDALDAARAETPDQVPQRLEANTDAYWRRVDNAVRGHLAMMGGANQDAEQRLYSTQSLWDNSMGETCSLALKRYPGHQVVHVNGGFHSAYWDGTVRQLALREPELRIATVQIVPVANPSVAALSDDPVADYIVFAEARATDRYDGKWGVNVTREIDYLFHFPKGESMNDRLTPVPLLVWFGDEGLTAEDGLALWRERLGDECAIAVLEAPYRETQEDLGEGGRWYWSDSFSSDIGTVQTAAERSISFLLRHYALDPDRICVGGEGAGATVVAALSLLSDRFELQGVAFEPRRYSKIRDFSLPLPEFNGGATRAGSLRVAATDASRDWWTEEFAQYAGIDFDCDFAEWSGDPWGADMEQEQLLRETLGLRAPTSSAGDSQGARRHVVAQTPRARLWARLQGLQHRQETGEPVAVVEGTSNMAGSDVLALGRTSDSFDEEHQLPVCPGAFGGTTVVVLPESADASTLEAWLALEKDDPLQARSRFLRLRVARANDADGPLGLAGVLSKLVSEGRSNVLIVPAVFCANGDAMRALRTQTRALEDQLTIHWRAGLGGLD
ncbi:MAG: putative iron-regulated protein [Chlamydiales bacterium]|jgi:uncharacterized iron-regulated protein